MLKKIEKKLSGIYSILGDLSAHIMHALESKPKFDYYTSKGIDYNGYDS